MERRKFIFVAASGVTTMIIPLGFYSCSNPKYDSAFAKPILLSNIWDTQIIAEIGELYQKQYLQENTEQELVEILSEGISMEKNDISESITSRIEEDFKTGKIVILDGWILSETEGRQCALFSLIQPK
tara:strand:- start:743 stop:1126 length:384 start_codon:yes stop_codon:yes gene_type:complete